MSDQDVPDGADRESDSHSAQGEAREQTGTKEPDPWPDDVGHNGYV